MKLETARKLKWPWPTRDWWLHCPICGDNISPFNSHCPHEECQEINKPSVEEMLERMPPDIIRNGYVKDLTICKFDEGTPGHFYSAGYCGTSGGYDHTVIFRGADLSEILALLFIWLRDNNLMEWKS